MAEVMEGEPVPADCPSEKSLYDTCAFSGGPSPGGETGRYSQLEKLGMLDTSPTKPFDRITKMMSTIFNTPVSLITLVADPTRVWFKSCVGPFGACVDRDGSWCNYVLVPPTPEVLVTEDASKDARFAHNPYVAGQPFIKFYAGAPLVGAKGERYGTLCIVDLKERAYTAELYSLLINFAALAVEEMERDFPLVTEACAAAQNDVERNRHLDLSVHAAREGMIMLDARDSNWPIIFANPAFEVLSGLDADKVVGRNFWDLLKLSVRSRPDLAGIMGKGDSFDLRLFCDDSGRWLTLRLMPATSDRFAPSKATGIPGWIPSENAPEGTKLGLDVENPVDITKRDSSTVPDTKCFWFAMAFVNADDDISTYDKFSFDSPSEDAASETTSARGTQSEHLSSGQPNSIRKSSSCGSAFGEHGAPIDIGDVELGPLLGSGSFGKVYRGVIAGETAVAVKMIDYRNRESGPHEKLLAEINLQKDLDHPGIVKLISSGATYEEEDGTKIKMVWMVQELCDMGNLTGATEAGWLRQERSMTSKPAMDVVYPTMGDVASGMAYLHGKNIIHSDLTGRNVLLARSERPHGFAGKVGDFGIARVTQSGAPLCTNTLGTITHMPPELLLSNLLYPAADVWAFGVIGWEAYYGKIAYGGKNAAQITLTVVRNRPLEWPEDAPEAFVSLMKTCMAYDPIGRPTFDNVLTTISQTQIS